MYQNQVITPVNNKHPLVEIPFYYFKQAPSSKDIGKFFKIPLRKYPPSFVFENDNYFSTGYFLNYDGVSIAQFEKLVTDKNWGDIANINGDFLIFCWDKIKSVFYVLTDQAGKFPCYFRVWKNNVLVSTDLSFLIKKHKCSLNLNIALDYICSGLFTFIYDETLLNEINQIPPATLLKISRPPDFSLESQVYVKKFVSISPEPYDSNEIFSRGILKVLGISVEKRLKTLNRYNFGAELSSGLDSGLICHLLRKISNKDFYCYSSFTQGIKIDTDRDLVKKFCLKNRLLVYFDKVNDYYPFNKNKYLRVYQDYPPSLTGVELANKSFEFAKEKESVAYFQGLGGDEAFKAHILDFWLNFEIQEFFFMTALRFKLGIEKVFAPKGLRYLISEERFAKRRIYPSIFSTSTVNANLNFFPIAWENGVWPITPFVDSEVVQYTRLKMPRRGLVASDKREILSSLNDVFVKEQFREKIGDEKLFDQFFINKREFIIGVLRNSILNKTNLFRIEVIIKDLERGKTERYLKDDTSFYLEYLVRLEYFLQNNNINIPY